MKIKFLLWSIAAACVLHTSALSQTNSIETIQASDLGKSVVVIGSLGLPLGTVTNIHVQIVDGSVLNTLRDAGTYAMKVLAIGDKKAENHTVLHFIEV